MSALDDVIAEVQSLRDHRDRLLRDNDDLRNKLIGTLSTNDQRVVDAVAATIAVAHPSIGHTTDPHETAERYIREAVKWARDKHGRGKDDPATYGCVTADSLGQVFVFCGTWHAPAVQGTATGEES